MKRGSLVVVGTGISVGHITSETRAWLERADKVLYCVADCATERLIRKLNPSSESLYVFYANDKNRSKTYAEMVQRILECVRSGADVCVAFYGHPGIFVNPSHEAIRIARAEGFKARMLPAVSSLDCLFADLGIDPSKGCQIFEATELLLKKRRVDVGSPVIIWQIACVGDPGFNFRGYDGRNFHVLIEYLRSFYPSEHQVYIYEAAQYPVCEPVINQLPLAKVSVENVTGISTMCLPPLRTLPVYLSAVDRLGLNSMLEGKTLIRCKVDRSGATA